MESIGEKLRNRRTEEGYSLDQVTRDTNIAKSYLEALESEDFAVFPGEPYLIGFLRNYSEYLGLDVDEMISLYKNFKIQEQPVPMDELLVKRGPSPVLFIVLGILLVGAVVAGGFFLYPGLKSATEKTAEAAPVEEQEQAAAEASELPEDAFLFSDEVTEQRFEVGDSIVVPARGEKLVFTIADAGEGVTLSTESGSVSLQLGEEKDIDLNGDGADDLKILVRDIDSAARTVVLRLDKSLYGPKAADIQATPPPAGSPQIASRTIEPRVVYRAPSPEVITMTLTFRGNCLFRYSVDSDPREERFFQKGEALRLNFSNTLRVWASNGGAVQGRLKGEDLPFGRSGQVVAWLFKWRIVDGQYELVLYPVY